MRIHWERAPQTCARIEVRYQNGREHLRHLLEGLRHCAPPLPNLSPRLGGALSAVGKHSDAVDAFLKAYALLPEDQAVKTALEVCQSNEGSSRAATALKFRSRVSARRRTTHRHDLPSDR